jgi:hypothetical protein
MMTTWTTRSATMSSLLLPQVAIRQTPARLGQCHQHDCKDASAMLAGGTSTRAKTQRDKGYNVSTTVVTMPA